MSDQSRLFSLLKQGATVITPNNRLSNHLLTSFSRAQTGDVHEKPRCLPYQMFLQESFRQHEYQNPQAKLPVLVSPQQLRYLWTQILSQSLGEPLNMGLIDEVQEAWRRCQTWQLTSDHPAFSLTPQTRQFQEWAKQLQITLRNEALITSEELVDFFLQQRTQFQATTIVWYCFDDYTPQQQSLQRYLKEQGCTLEFMDLPEKKVSVSLDKAEDEDDERLQLAYWLQDRLEAGDKRIAVVVPDLQSQAQVLQRFLQRHVPPTFFDISLGQALIEFPLVAHALSWLGLSGQTLTNQRACLLLSSPYLGDSKSELSERAQALQDCTVLQEQTIDYSQFVSQIGRFAPKLARLLGSLDAYPQQATVADWVSLFRTRLQHLGFPGEYGLNSATYQCYHRFLNLFEEFNQLAMLTSILTQEQALSAIETLARNTIFQTQKSESRIQILGLLEASGCVFDSLWMMGATDECLPQKTRLSAFIPVALQREYLMPHASPDRELALATTIVERLKNSSNLCVFSYPCLSKDKPNLPSPLLHGLESYEAQNRLPEQTATCLELFEDTYDIPFATNEKLSASSSMLGNQAKCPFRAFASHRLHARKGTSPTDGPNQMERGQIIHKVMELIWQEIKTQQQLLSLSTQALDELIQRAITLALEPYGRLRKHSFPKAIQTVETERLQRLAHVCLDWERQRPAFEVEALEKSFTLELSGITFNLRLDRLDRVAGDKKWVIDYKTTLPASLPWKEEERPKDPQLLLYSLLDERINTLLFSELKEGRIQCKGLTDEAYELEGLASLKEGESWGEQREQWRNLLSALADEYRRGYCPPQPVSSSVCQQCDYQSLCRYSG
jgi:probable DNA repair protein